jgi:anti-anti-sigma regulatory factor
MSTSRSSSQPNRAGLTEMVDTRRGAIRVSGHLTARGADLLRGTVEALHRDGHSTVVMDLEGLRDADDAGLQALRTMRRSLAAEGGNLFLVSPPRRLAARL